MASFLQYTANGQASQSFSIESFTSDEIKVRVDGELKTASTHYNITSYTVNGGTVTWTAGNAPNQKTVRIYRDTKLLNSGGTAVQAKATYFAGSSMKADDLNNNQKQVLRALEEQDDQLIQRHDIENDSIDGSKIADDAVNSEHIVDGSIDLAHMSPNSIDSDQYVNGSIDKIHLAADVIDSTKIEDDAINEDHIRPDSIHTQHILNNNVTLDKLGSGALPTDITIASANIVNGTIVGEDIADDAISENKIAANSITTDHLQPDSVRIADIKDLNVTEVKLAVDAVTTTKIKNGAVGENKIADDAVSISKISDPQLKDLANNLTSTAAELNQLDGKTISSGSLTDSATTIPTSSAVNSRIITLLDALGGFVAIANEVSFPNTNPDPEDDAGTAVSIGDAGGISIDSNGTSTTGRTLGGATVTITGFPSSMRGIVGGDNKILAAGMGLIVQTTSTLNTYTYHKAIGTDSDIITISDTVSSFNQRYRFGSTDPTSDNDQGDLFFNTTTNLFKVFDDGVWIKTVPSDADLSNIGIVAGELGWSDDLGFITDALSTASAGDINTVADNITSVNRYADEYKIASSAPGSPSEGDLWYDTVNDCIKYFTGSVWLKAFTPNDLLDEDNMSSNSATKAASQQSVKAYVDSQTESDTTYSISCEDGDNSDEEKIRLTAGGTGSGTDDVVLEAGTGLSVARDGDKITFTNTVSNTDTQLTEEQVEDFVGGMLTGNTETGITVTYQDADGTIDFVVASQTDENFTTADHAKLDGIEASATADQTAAEIRTLVESASDSNVFTDDDHSKLNAIEASATADQTAAEIRTLVDSATDSNVFTDNDHSKLDGIEASATADQTDAEIRTAVGNASDSNIFTDALKSKLDGIEASATADQTAEEIEDIVGAMVSSNTETGITVTYQDADGTIDFVVASQTDENFTTADHAKLDGIEASATADQTAAEIRTLVESASDSNVFTDDDHSKLNGIEASATADQTGAEIKSAYEGESDTNAYTDAEKTKLAGIEASATADQTDAEIRAAVEAASDSNVFTDADHSKLNAIEASADVTDATNVNAAGAVMNSDTTTADMQFVVDEDNMSSDSATKVPSQQSVKAYVDTEVAGVVDSAPGALNTLNELAAALGDDANFSTTVTNSIAAKLPLGGGTMTGNIVMSGSETVDGRDLSVDGAKLDGIEASATADQTNAEIRAAVEAASDSNVFTDADHSKLNGIAASANNYSISSDLLDEDDLSSNSATKVPSQQSVKTYVDNNSGGNAATFTAADESSDTTCFPVFTTAATGAVGAKTGSNLTFNSSSGALTATLLNGGAGDDLSLDFGTL